MILAYDIEIYPNLLVINFIDVYDFEQRWSFVAHKSRNDISALKQFLNQPNLTLVGFNSIRFDDMLLKGLLMGLLRSVKQTFNLAERIIKRDEIPEYWDIHNYQVAWESIDIMVLHRFREMGVSLKFLGIVIKHPLVQDLPISPGTIIKKSEVAKIIEYCYNDCEITAKAFLLSKEELAVRIELGNLFGVDVHTDSRSGAAQRIMVEQYSRKTNIPVRELKNNQTWRKQIRIAECVGPNLVFESEQLKGLLAVLNKITLYLETDARTDTYVYKDGKVSVDEEIDHKPYFPLEVENIDQFHTLLHKASPYLRKTGIGNNRLEYDIRITNNFKYATILDFMGTTFKVGIGGLHSKDKPGVYKTDDEWQLVLADVSSYYPSLQDVNEITPEHWGKHYLEILRNLIHERLVAKELGKKDPAQARKALALKIVINSIFGRLGDKFSPLLDVKALTTVTLSGQLYLLDFIEKIRLNLKRTKLISANTDGVWCLVHRSELEQFKKIGDEWSERLGLVLDNDHFKALYQRDVNNYIAIDEHDKVKTKGDFTVGSYDGQYWNRPLEKGFDAPIVAIAIYKFLIDGIAPATTITEHNDIYDYMIAKKVGRQFKTITVDADNNTRVLQKTNRFIVSNSGVSLVKRRSTGELENMIRGELVTVTNDVVDRNPSHYDIKHGYYLDRVDRILGELFPPQKKLLDF